MLFTSSLLRILNNSDKVVPVSTISSTIIIFLFFISFFSPISSFTAPVDFVPIYDEILTKDTSMF